MMIVTTVVWVGVYLISHHGIVILDIVLSFLERVEYFEFTHWDKKMGGFARTYCLASLHPGETVEESRSSMTLCINPATDAW
jgi:hypothetical protein